MLIKGYLGISLDMSMHVWWSAPSRWTVRQASRNPHIHQHLPWPTLAWLVHVWYTVHQYIATHVPYFHAPSKVSYAPYQSLSLSLSQHQNRRRKEESAPQNPPSPPEFIGELVGEAFRPSHRRLPHPRLEKGVLPHAFFFCSSHGLSTTSNPFSKPLLTELLLVEHPFGRVRQPPSPSLFLPIPT